jgi:hypothetical protein
MMPDEFVQRIEIESSTSYSKSLQFLSDSEKLVKRDIISEAVAAGTFDSLKGYSIQPSMYNSEHPPVNVVTVVTSIFPESSVSSPISSIETNIETHDELTSPFSMTPTADIGWTVFFGLMIGGAIIGNLVVIWIVLGKEYDKYRGFKHRLRGGFRFTM